MKTAKSACATKGEFRSASEKTAMLVMPIFLQVRMILEAISPRLAMRILFIFFMLSGSWTFQVQHYFFISKKGVKYCIVQPTGLHDSWPLGACPLFSQGDVAVGRIN